MDDLRDFSRNHKTPKNSSNRRIADTTSLSCADFLSPLRRQQVTGAGVGLYRYFHDTALRLMGAWPTISGKIITIATINICNSTNGTAPQ